jgi:hypothetical protein
MKKSFVSKECDLKIKWKMSVSQKIKKEWQWWLQRECNREKKSVKKAARKNSGWIKHGLQPSTRPSASVKLLQKRQLWPVYWQRETMVNSKYCPIDRRVTNHSDGQEYKVSTWTHCFTGRLVFASAPFFTAHCAFTSNRQPPPFVSSASTAQYHAK